MCVVLQRISWTASVYVMRVTKIPDSWSGLAPEVHSTDCQHCSVNTMVVSTSVVLDHTLKQHKQHPRFHVTCLICGAVHKKYDSYRKHFSRQHPDRGYTKENCSNSESYSAFSLMENPPETCSNPSELLVNQLTSQSAAFVAVAKLFWSNTGSCRLCGVTN